MHPNKASCIFFPISPRRYRWWWNRRRRRRWGRTRYSLEGLCMSLLCLLVEIEEVMMFFQKTSNAPVFVVRVMGGSCTLITAISLPVRCYYY